MPNDVGVLKKGEGDEAHFVVCAKATFKVPYTDNKFDFCCKCGEKVQFRPDAPSVPKKICLECALPDMEKSAKKNDLQIRVSEEGAKLIERWRSEQ